MTLTSLSRELLLNAKQPVERIGILWMLRERIHDLRAGCDGWIRRRECNGIAAEESVEYVYVVAGVSWVVRRQIEAEPHGQIKHAGVGVKDRLAVPNGSYARPMRGAKSPWERCTATAWRAESSALRCRSSGCGCGFRARRCCSRSALRDSARACARRASCPGRRSRTRSYAGRASRHSRSSAERTDCCSPDR